MVKLQAPKWSAFPFGKRNSQRRAPFDFGRHRVSFLTLALAGAAISARADTFKVGECYPFERVNEIAVASGQSAALSFNLVEIPKDRQSEVVERDSDGTPTTLRQLDTQLKDMSLWRTHIMMKKSIQETGASDADASRRANDLFRYLHLAHKKHTLELPKRRFTLTSNKSGSKGYAMSADTEMGVTPTQYCVNGELKDISMFHPDEAFVPKQLSGDDDLALQAQFDRSNRGFEVVLYGKWSDGRAFYVSVHKEGRGSIYEETGKRIKRAAIISNWKVGPASGYISLPSSKLR